MEDNLIERYFCGELPAEERAAFEQRRAEDAAFRREVEGYEKTLRLIRLEGRQALKARLAERGRQLDAENAQAGFRPRWWMGLLALALAVLAWWVWDGRTAPSPSALPGSEIRRDTAEAAVPPPASDGQAGPKPSAGSEPSPSPPTAERASSNDELFAAYFRPYRDESLEPAVRGEGELTPEEQFRQLYWDGQYRDALAAFEGLEASSRNNSNLQFLQANCLLATGQAKAAAVLLENVLQTGRARFLAEARWLLALACLNDGEREKAKALLQQIAEDVGSPRRGEAVELLGGLQ